MKQHILTAFVLIAVIISGYIGYQWFNTPLVSVVMLTYKRADILPEAIDSVLAQTYPDFELIILNDGSPDNTDEVVKKYQDKRIRYYKNKQNKGIAYSRNRATSLARGKYIMIMDDDDISLPTRIEKQTEYLNAHPNIDVLAGQIKDYPRQVPQTHDVIASELIQWNMLGNANIMYRRQFAKDHHIKYDEDLPYGEDWHFWVQMVLAGAKFAAIPDDVIERNEHSQKHYQANDTLMHQKVKNMIGNFFSKENPEEFYKADSCQKLQLIKSAPIEILSKAFLEQLILLNCPQVDATIHQQISVK